MKDDLTKQKQKRLIEMVSCFCDANLDDEFCNLSVKLVEKLGRKHDVPFKRGNLENWASGIIYALAQINFLFDESFEPHTSPDDICRFFATKKSTASNKAREIRRMLNLDYYDSEFSAGYILASKPSYYLDESGFIIKDGGNALLEMLMDEIRQNNCEIDEDFFNFFILNLMNSKLICAPIDDGLTLLEIPTGEKFFAFFTSSSEFDKTFPEMSEFIMFSFYDFCEIFAKGNADIGIAGVKINPDNQDIFISCEMMIDFYEAMDEVVD